MRIWALRKNAADFKKKSSGCLAVKWPKWRWSMQTKKKSQTGIEFVLMLLSLACSIIHRLLGLIAGAQLRPGSVARLYSISFHGLSRLPLNASRWLNSETKTAKRATLPHLLGENYVFCFHAQSCCVGPRRQHACWWCRAYVAFIFLCLNLDGLCKCFSKQHTAHSPITIYLAREP